jgi:hypothetical protein
MFLTRGQTFSAFDPVSTVVKNHESENKTEFRHRQHVIFIIKKSSITSNLSTEMLKAKITDFKDAAIFSAGIFSHESDT